MNQHRLTDDFRRNRDRFTVAYPAGRDFLVRLEEEGPLHGLWLSTAVNAHLYKDNGFLAYLRLKNPELRPPSLLLSPNFNQQIARHTTDQAMLVFPAIAELLQQHRATQAGWVERRARGAFELLATTPARFYQDLFDELATIPMPPV